jgi:hypothetical protein
LSLLTISSSFTLQKGNFWHLCRWVGGGSIWTNCHWTKLVYWISSYNNRRMGVNHTLCVHAKSLWLQTVFQHWRVLYWRTRIKHLYSWILGHGLRRELWVQQVIFTWKSLSKGDAQRQ